MPSASFTLRTPAKVNFFLNIRGKRPDGYHDVTTVLQAITLFDELTFQPDLDMEYPDIHLTCSMPELPTDERNLVVKAYRLFWRETGLPPMGLKVHLQKNIPIQAGLGGGSSDAAAMLIALQHLSFERLSRFELHKMAARLGSDVPFFLFGGTALATGRGEFVKPLFSEQQSLADTPLPPLYSDPLYSMVVIKPSYTGISSESAYRAVAENGFYAKAEPVEIIRAIQQGWDPGELSLRMWNDFETVIVPPDPALATTFRLMKACGFNRPLLCGSGAALCGFLKDDARNRQQVAGYFPMSEYEVFWVRPWPNGIEQYQPQLAGVR